MYSSLCLVFILARPDPVTINYFAHIVNLCVGEGTDYEDEKGDKLEKIINILALSEAELQEYTDSKSIRSTCRKLVRVVFKQQLADPDIAFGNILKDKGHKAKVAAICGTLNNLVSDK